MKRIARNVLLLGVAVLTGCIFSPKKEDPTPVHDPYSQPTAPESLIANLQASYRNREIEHYAEILAPEFIFKFQPLDADDIGTPFWTRDQDSTGTRALLTTTEVSDVRIGLIYGARDTAVNFPGTPLDSLKIRIITTDLQVDQTDGTTWLVQDQQDMYFRKGIESNGENPDYWWLYEWDDLPTLAAPGVRPLSSGASPAQEYTTSWGGLLQKAAKPRLSSP
jgi:hypothetical protein